VTRIVGGQAGGRRIAVPPGRTVRPTSERLREALASALEARLGGLAGRTVLDLFAGTGAVGLELLSRGAAAVTLVESDPAVLEVLRANVATLGLAGAAIVGGRAETVTAQFPAAAQFDVVFLDPPYALDVDRILAAAAGYAREVLAVERGTRSPGPSWPAGFDAPQTRRYGDSTLWYGLRS
jgi:16S rRNA (guanine966-N2)-methyltransferase